MPARYAESTPESTSCSTATERAFRLYGPGPFLDPVAAWRALPARAQEEIGAAAIALTLGCSGAGLLTDAGNADAARPYDTAAHEALGWLHMLVDVAVLREAGGIPPVPDLRPLGVQQCQGCGCTDHYGCPTGCSWATEDLCSACAGAPT